MNRCILLFLMLQAALTNGQPPDEVEIALYRNGKKFNGNFELCLAKDDTIKKLIEPYIKNNALATYSLNVCLGRDRLAIGNILDSLYYVHIYLDKTSFRKSGQHFEPNSLKGVLKKKYFVDAGLNIIMVTHRSKGKICTQTRK